MGCFDTVHVRCATCGTDTKVQTKAGACDLAHYRMEQAPPDITGALHGCIVMCSNGHATKIFVQTLVTLHPNDETFDEEEFD